MNSVNKFRKQEKGGKRRAYKKKLSTEKICLYKTTTFPNERKARSSTIPAVIHNTGCRRPFYTHPFMNQPREPGCPTPAQPVGRSRRGPRALRLGAQALRQERPPRRRQLASCLHHLLHTRRRHGKDANTLAVCNIGLHGRAEMSAPVI